MTDTIIIIGQEETNFLKARGQVLIFLKGPWGVARDPGCLPALGCAARGGSYCYSEYPNP